MLACWTSGSAHLQDAEPTNGPLGLPIELLTEIIKVLPWKDVLNMRKTCKLLSEATKTRAVWAHLVEEHISSKEVPPRLERPIELHTSHELERMVLLWKSAEIGWTRDDGHCARERFFICEVPEFTHLINGGRWFLVTSRTGAVTYYDLEAETILGVQLIPSQFPIQDLYVVVEMDTSSPLLRFKMAFSSKFRTVSTSDIPKATHRYIALYVWSVEIMLDDSGHAVGLSASRLAALRHHRALSIILDFDFHGPYVAFTCARDLDEQDYLIVMRWDQGEKDLYYWRIVATARTFSSVRLSLLPEDRLLSMTSSAFAMFDFSTVEETVDLPDVNGYINSAPLWKALLEFCPRRNPISVFPLENTTKIYVSGIRSLFTFSIDSDSVISPPVFEISRYSEPRLDPVYALGFAHGIFYDNDQRSTRLMAYNPSSEAHPSCSVVFKTISSNTSQKFNILAMDEETGRVVLNHTGATMGYVMDFALAAAP